MNKTTEKKTMSVQVPTALYMKIAREAKRRGLSVSDVVRGLLIGIWTSNN